MKRANASILTGVLVVLSGCSAGETADRPAGLPTVTSPTAATVSPTAHSSTRTSYTVFTLTSRNGTRREARTFGSGQVGVVLTHMGNPDSRQEDWRPYAEELAARGYRVVTFQHDGVQVDQDVLAAADRLRTDGATRVVAIGASLGGMASLRAAESPQSPLDAVIWVAGVLQSRRYTFTRTDVAKVSCPVLVTAGRRDVYGAGNDAPVLHGWLPGSGLVLLDSDQHGTDILRRGGPVAAQLRQAMSSFLAKLPAKRTHC